jgi:serine protease AprX
MRQNDHISGTGGGPGTRANALWGKGKRRYALLLALAVMALALAAGASTNTVAAAGPKKADVPKDLKDKAKDNPDATIPVIIQTSDPSQVGSLDAAVGKAQKKHPGGAKGVKKDFTSLSTVSADVTGDQLDELSSDPSVTAISEDAPVRATGYGNSQSWAATVGTQWGPAPRGAKYPTIAIVDSGVQGRDDFGGRLVKSLDFTPDGADNGGGGGDGFGHGTLVAGLAIGGSSGHTGAEPRGKVVSLDVLDNSGNGRVSDVLAACDWILQNRDKYNIQIANFSINAGSGLGIAMDPLNKAVEKLWLNGVVVVVAAGNYAQDGAASGVGFAPANDPFVITVGASDTNDTVTPDDDFAAPWSAWGYTQDGFAKPELAAPGRMMNGPAPKDSTMYGEFPSRKVGDGYMWMSGTSFAAPLVSGAAATILSRHPDWTPDQVKGALMASADVPRGYSSPGAMGVGILDVAGAIKADGKANPNAGLDRFVTTDSSTGLKTFDASGWSAAATSEPAWNAASWSSASWASASWSSASWSSASWSSASWASASWSSASWSSASWSSASWSSASWASNFGSE